MAWIMHSSGPWKDHKYKERKGEPGNYTYKYGDEKSNDGPTVTTVNQHDQYGDHPAQYINTPGKRNTYAGNRERMKRVGGLRSDGSIDKVFQAAVRDTYYADRTGYQRTNNARHDLVGDDNEAKKKHTKYNNKRKDFEKMTLTSMRNALNSAKENKKKSDADMRDAAVARGREQYMTNRAKKTVGAMTKAIEKKREEEKRKAYSHSRLNRIMGR